MKIAIIDLHPIVRSGLRIFLKENFGELTLLEATNIQDFQDQYPEATPDLILLTVGQSKSPNTLKAIDVARSKFPDSKLILNDEAPDFYSIGSYLTSGIYGYIAKQSRIRDLVECIQDVMDGKRYICNLVFNTMPESRARVSHTAIANAKDSVLLSPKQKEIAEYLVQGKRTSEIAKILGRSLSTISTTKMNIMGKYNVDNILKLRTAMNNRALEGDGRKKGLQRPVTQLNRQ